MKPDPYYRAGQALDSHGRDAAEEVASLEVRQIKVIADLVKQENIDCDFVLTRVTDVYLYSKARDETKAMIDRLTDAGISTVDDIFYGNEESAETVSKTVLRCAPCQLLDRYLG